jgi:deoxyadenosine/deoxycytidine kinase
MRTMAPEERTSFVAVAGSIAVGKTGLVTRLSEALGAVALREEVGRNAYFDLFYDDPERWAFHSQVAFAADSMARHARATGEEHVIQDRTIYEVVDVFSRLLVEMGDLDSEEFRILADLRDGALKISRQPTVMIYLHAPPATLLERAAGRGRPAERHLTHDYLQRLQKHYDGFVGQWNACPVLTVDTAARDLRQDYEIDCLISELRSMQDS